MRKKKRKDAHGEKNTKTKTKKKKILDMNGKQNEGLSLGPDAKVNNGRCCTDE